MDAASTDGSVAGHPSATRATLVELTLALTRLVAIGLLAIGVSGLIAWGMGAALGRAFVAGDAPGVTYTSSRCAELLEYARAARTCEAAAVSHHYGEVVTYRLAAGVLGLLVLAGYLIVRRRLGGRRGRGRERGAEPVSPEPVALPDGFVATVGTVAFGLAGLGLLVLGASQLALGPDAGAGAWLSGGIVALAVAIPFGARLWRCLVRGPVSP